MLFFRDGVSFKKRAISFLGKFLFFLFFLSIDYLLTHTFFLSEDTVCNYSCALGITCFISGVWIMLLFPLSIVGFFFFRAKNIQETFGWGLMFVGGISNILDRLFFGCVYDIFPFFNLFYWNIADGYIFFGVIIVLFSLFFSRKYAIMK